MNYIKEYVDRIERFLTEEWDEESRNQVTKCLLDTCAVTIAGSSQMKQRHQQYLSVFPAGGKAVVVGLNQKADMLSAALLNGISAHALELDDGQRFAMLHPGAVVVPALLPLLDEEGVDAQSFLAGIAAGYEAAIRLACAVQPTHKKKGFHATATCGAVGAAVAVAVARGYRHGMLLDAVSAALTSASGLLEIIEDDSQLKPYHCGKAAVNGLIAANIARCGYPGPKDALGGERGFLAVLNGGIDRKGFDMAMEQKDCISTVYRKLHASCRHAHAPVDAALMLRRDPGFDPRRIREVTVSTYDLAVYGHDRKDVHSVSAAKMSIPYAVSVALAYGRSGVDAYSAEMLEDDLIGRIAGRVKVEADPVLSAMAPGKRAAELKVILDDGECFFAKVECPKGEPENPLKNEELMKKSVLLLHSAGADDVVAKELAEYTNCRSRKDMERLALLLGRDYHSEP